MKFKYMAFAFAALVGLNSLSGAQDRRGGGRSRAETEREVRAAINNQLKRALGLPDSELVRVSEIAFRFRDSANGLQARERFVREELRRESRTAEGRVPSEQRIGCLLDAFWSMQQQRLSIRLGEQRELAFLTPLQRLGYLGVQERLHELIDDRIEAMERAGVARGQGMPLRGQGQGPLPGGRQGRQGGPLRGGPGGRGPPFNICPPAAGG